MAAVKAIPFLSAETFSRASRPEKKSERPCLILISIPSRGLGSRAYNRSVRRAGTIPWDKKMGAVFDLGRGSVWSGRFNAEVRALELESFWNHPPVQQLNRVNGHFGLVNGQ